jgi:hypothetical protein
VGAHTEAILAELGVEPGKQLGFANPGLKEKISP